MQTICGDTASPSAPDVYCRFGLLIGSVYRQWRKKVDESFKEHGLTDATRMPLVVLFRHGQPMLQKDLAQALSLDSSSLVRVLAQLREAQWVQWDSDPADRRTKRIALTEQGEQMASKIWEKGLEMEQAILADLSEHELQVTRTALHKIALSFSKLESSDVSGA